MPRDRTALPMPMEELIIELLVRLGVWGGMLLWDRARLRDPVDTRWDAARHFLAAHARTVGDRDGRVVARLGPERGDAEITLERAGGRVRMACAWDGGGVRFAPLDPRAHGLPVLLVPLQRVGGIDSVESNGRTLTISGDTTLAHELDHASRVLAAIAGIGRRTRERAGPELARHAGAGRRWSIDVTSAGTRIVLRRPVLGGLPVSFRVSHDGRVACDGSEPPERVREVLGPGPVSIVTGAGEGAVSWPDVPSAAQIERAEHALAAIATLGPYRS